MTEYEAVIIIFKYILILGVFGIVCGLIYFAHKNTLMFKSLKTIKDPRAIKILFKDCASEQSTQISLEKIVEMIRKG